MYSEAGPGSPQGWSGWYMQGGRVSQDHPSGPVGLARQPSLSWDPLACRLWANKGEI